MIGHYDRHSRFLRCSVALAKSASSSTLRARSLVSFLITVTVSAVEFILDMPVWSVGSSVFFIFASGLIASDNLEFRRFLNIVTNFFQESFRIRLEPWIHQGSRAKDFFKKSRGDACNGGFAQVDATVLAFRGQVKKGVLSTARVAASVR